MAALLEGIRSNRATFKPGAATNSPDLHGLRSASHKTDKEFNFQLDAR
jgi:hypothetical protein